MPAPSKPSVSSPGQHNPNNRPVSHRLRDLVALVLVTVVTATLIFAARRLFISPTVEGEAFLVAESLDVKKLGDLKVYLLHDPYPAIAEVKKGMVEHYELVRKNAFGSNPVAQQMQGEINNLKEQLTNLDAQKRREVEKTSQNIEETLRQLSAEAETLRSEKTNVENQIKVLTQQLEPARKELVSSQGSRSAIQSYYTGLLQRWEAERAASERALQDCHSRALAAAAKLINDDILIWNLGIELVPQDGKFDQNDRSAISASYYPGEIFEIKQEAGSLKEGELGFVISDEDLGYGSHVTTYGIFTRFPGKITSAEIRDRFVNTFKSFIAQRDALEPRKDAAVGQIGSLEEAQKKSLQKFDYQYGARMQSLENYVQAARSQLDLLQRKLESFTKDIAAKESFLNKPRSEQLTSLRSDVERVFAERATPIQKQLASAQTDLEQLIAQVMSEEWLRTMDSVKGKVADVIAAKIAATARTDSDGRFVIRPPGGGVFIVYAEPEAPFGRVFWFERIKVFARGKTALTLSNSNAQKAPSLADLLFQDFAEPKQRDRR